MMLHRHLVEFCLAVLRVHRCVQPEVMVLVEDEVKVGVVVIARLASLMLVTVFGIPVPAPPAGARARFYDSAVFTSCRWTTWRVENASTGLSESAANGDIVGTGTTAAAFM